MMSELYDKNCNLICHPDGGFSGGGYGKCPDFSNGILMKKIVWGRRQEIRGMKMLKRGLSRKKGCRKGVFRD